jgi:hypothetical protein
MSVPEAAVEGVSWQAYGLTPKTWRLKAGMILLNVIEYKCGLYIIADSSCSVKVARV